MPKADNAENRIRTKIFDDTHQSMIETGVKLISEKGVDALSIAAIAREMEIDRTTVYYHFRNRDELLDAVFSWATEQLAKGMDVSLSEEDRAEQVTRFVLENPVLIKIWIDRFVSGDNIRDSYTRWDQLVTSLGRHFADKCPEQHINPEVYCVIMLCAAIIGPRVYANSVHPEAPLENTLSLFLKEGQRMLKRDGLFSGDSNTPQD